MYEIGSEKVKLPDNQWAFILKEMKHSTQSAHDLIAQQCLVGPNGETLVKQSEAISIASDLMVDLTKGDGGALNDCLILGQVKEWSFGDVTQAVLDELPERLRILLVEEVKARCASPLPANSATS